MGKALLHGVFLFAVAIAFAPQPDKTLSFPGAKFYNKGPGRRLNSAGKFSEQAGCPVKSDGREIRTEEATDEKAATRYLMPVQKSKTV